MTGVTGAMESIPARVAAERLVWPPSAQGVHGAVCGAVAFGGPGEDEAAALADQAEVASAVAVAFACVRVLDAACPVEFAWFARH